MAAFQSRTFGLGIVATIFVLGSDSASAVTLMESSGRWCYGAALAPPSVCSRPFPLRLSWLVCSRCRSLLFLLFLTSPSIFIPLPPHSHPSPVSPSLPLFIIHTFFLLSFSARRHSGTKSFAPPPPLLRHSFLRFFLFLLSL